MGVVWVWLTIHTLQKTVIASVPWPQAVFGRSQVMTAVAALSPHHWEIGVMVHFYHWVEGLALTEPAPVSKVQRPTSGQFRTGALV